MSSLVRRLKTGLGVAFVMTACSDPECPDGFDKIGDICKRADGGMEAVTAGDASSGGGQTAGNVDAGDAAVTQDGAVGPMGIAPGATGNDGQSPVDAATSMVQPLPECDATRPCSAGLVCVDNACVSACTQTQCDPNATCSLVNNAPTCSCKGDFVNTGSGSSVVCTRDPGCNCDTNAACEIVDGVHQCKCKTGYTGDGASCAPVSCATPTLENGTVTTPAGASFGNQARYECDPGYVFVGQGTVLTRTCNAFGHWSGVTPSCSRVSCGLPPTVENATVSNNSSHYGDQATYTCLSSYALNGPGTITCLASGSWSTPPQCKRDTYCGDGAKNGLEQCDPSAPGWSYWTCTDTCQRWYGYQTCSGNRTDPLTGGQVGIECQASQACVGYCSPSCTTDSACPAAPAASGLVARCLTQLHACVLEGCSGNSECPTGMACVFFNGFASKICTFCQTDDACTAPKKCVVNTSTSLGRCL